MVSFFFHPLNFLLTSGSSLMQRLIIRIINHFDTQVRVPYGDKGGHHTKTTSEASYGGEPNGKPHGTEQSSDHPEDGKAVTEQKNAEWYGKILEHARLRYRKIQRYAR